MMANYILLGILLSLSFYFSGFEAAMFSLNRLERNALLETKAGKKRKILVFLLENQEPLLITILTGNMVVNIFSSSIGSVVGEKIFKGQSELFSIMGMTILLLLVGELTPKRIAVNHSKTFTRLASPPMFYLHHLLTPVRYFLTAISGFVLKLFPVDLKGSGEDNHALVLSTAELGYNQAILKHSEYNLFKSYLSFKKKKAGNVMIPRNELKTLSCDLTAKEAMGIIAADREYLMNSTVLLHKEDGDHLIGWIPLAELLQCRTAESDGNVKIKTLSRKFHAVPQSKKLPQLIGEMRQAGECIALILDEYGGTAGVLWFRNIIEDVLRVFYSPFKEKFDEEKHGGTTIPGNMSIEDLEDFLDTEFLMDVETAAGLFLRRFGGIPVPGDEIRIGEMRMAVREMAGNRIKTLEIDMRPEK